MLRPLAEDVMIFSRACVAAVMCAALLGCSREVSKQTAPERLEADAAIVSELVGVATVVDADTIRVGPRRIRFDGILAPAQNARCGDVNLSRASADALREITNRVEVRCRISDIPDARGRDIAQCRAGDVDIQARMVELGMARDWPQHSNGAYADEEATARAARLGGWAASCSADVWEEDAE
jgi:endonuclease YncB( thermonuclease family)